MNCPICGSSNVRPYLTLQDSPIYQHPVDKSADIPEPHTYTIQYAWCDGCSHCYQEAYELDVLNNIYSNHYYTPATDGIGDTFRKDFFELTSSYLNKLENIESPNVLEIGSSTGEVLLAIKERYPASSIIGFEPNEEAANTATKNGVLTRKEFFNENTVSDIGKYDLIFSRHVIEHISDFDSFFNAVNAITGDQSLLILETPSLDFAHNNLSIAPFHIEHLHVFSGRSLQALAKNFGWITMGHKLSESGNMILIFGKHENGIDLPQLQYNDKLQSHISKLKQRLIEEVGNKKILIWGAGAGGRTILAYTGFTDFVLMDANKNKQGKVFCGLPNVVEYAPDIVQSIVESGRSSDYVIVIGSTFFNEIRRDISAIGWSGSIVSPYEWGM